MNTDFLAMLTDGDRAAVKRACVSRGKRKGAMKAAAPSAVKDAQAWAAWHAIKCVSTRGATHTESVTFTLIKFPEARETWDRVAAVSIVSSLLSMTLLNRAILASISGVLGDNDDAALEIAEKIQSKG